MKLSLDLEEVPVRSSVSEEYITILSEIEQSRALMNRQQSEEP